MCAVGYMRHLRLTEVLPQTRYEVVMAIVTTAKRDFSIVAESEDLLEFVKERTLDKKVLQEIILGVEFNS